MNRSGCFSKKKKKKIYIAKQKKKQSRNKLNQSVNESINGSVNQSTYDKEIISVNRSFNQSSNQTINRCKSINDNKPTIPLTLRLYITNSRFPDINQPAVPYYIQHMSSANDTLHHRSIPSDNSHRAVPMTLTLLHRSRLSDNSQ